MSAVKAKQTRIEQRQLFVYAEGTTIQHFQPPCNLTSLCTKSHWNAIGIAAAFSTVFWGNLYISLHYVECITNTLEWKSHFKNGFLVETDSASIT